MEIPPELDSWVAHDGQAATEVKEPCYIEYTAIDDLHFYHPGYGGPLPFTFKHVADRDTSGERKAFVRAVELSHNWDQKMAQVMYALKLYPTKVGDYDVLVDNEIGNVNTPEMHGWKVIKWTVVKSRDSHLALVHQDLIEWSKDDVLARSMFSWRPYEPVGAVQSSTAAGALRGSRK